jgi:hypothetical protein
MRVSELIELLKDFQIKQAGTEGGTDMEVGVACDEEWNHVSPLDIEHISSSRGALVFIAGHEEFEFDRGR